MIDITTNPEDKDNFIVKVYMKDEEANYNIVYASGREEVCELSLHNLNATLALMESQFLSFKDEYLQKTATFKSKLVMKRITEAILAVLGMVLTSAIDIPDVVNGLLAMLIIIYTIYYQTTKDAQENACDRGLEVVMLGDWFLKNKDKFKIRVIDPKSNQEEDWYLLTLSEIEQIRDQKELERLSTIVDDDVKEEEKINTENALRKKYGM